VYFIESFPQYILRCIVAVGWIMGMAYSLIKVPLKQLPKVHIWPPGLNWSNAGKIVRLKIEVVVIVVEATVALVTLVLLWRRVAGVLLFYYIVRHVS